MKALITFPFNKEEFKQLEDLGYEIIFKDEKNIQYSEDMKDIDILVCFNPFNKLDISIFPNLKWIQLLSAGVNHVPADIVLDKNILLTNNRGGYSIPIAEWIVLKSLEMIKNTKEFYELQSRKDWKMDTSLLELYGKTIGFLGTGSIAKEAAKRLEAFGVNIIGINTSGAKVDYFHETYPINRINEVIGKCDFIVITTPYTDKTHHLVDENLFSNMKDGVYLINIARGSIIDEKAMIQNLKNGKIRKAALDVFEVEPLSIDSPLWDMDNVLISPHNSWASEMNHKRRFQIAYNNMKNYLNNNEMINIINLNKGY